MPSPHFRPGRPADAAALAELGARTFADTFGADNTPEDLQAHLLAAYGVPQQTAELEDPDIRTVLVCRGDTLIGYAQVRRSAAPHCVVQSDPVELHRFYLDRTAHGSGLATRLLHEVHAAAHALGGQTLWLGVWERNPRAIRFYAKSGFHQVGSHVFMVGSDAQTDWVLSALVAADARLPPHASPAVS